MRGPRARRALTLTQTLPLQWLGARAPARAWRQPSLHARSQSTPRPGPQAPVQWLGARTPARASTGSGTPHCVRAPNTGPASFRRRPRILSVTATAPASASDPPRCTRSDQAPPEVSAVSGQRRRVTRGRAGAPGSGPSGAQAHLPHPSVDPICTMLSAPAARRRTYPTLPQTPSAPGSWRRGRCGAGD
jgi:hypothetical protein